MVGSPPLGRIIPYEQERLRARRSLLLRKYPAPRVLRGHAAPRAFLPVAALRTLGAPRAARPVLSGCAGTGISRCICRQGSSAPDQQCNAGGTATEGRPHRGECLVRL